MEISFTNKRILVTGAGKGIGRDVCRQLVKCGAKVIAVSKTIEHLQTLKNESPHAIDIICVDLNNWSETRASLQNIGTVDGLVNNAAVANLEHFMDITEESLDSTFNVNVKAVFNVSQIVTQKMIETGNGGSIVNVSSQASIRGLRDHTAYCASKGALEAATRAMALELGKHKIRVNTVQPTVVMTDMGRLGWSDPQKCTEMFARIPLGRFAEVHEVVDAILFLLSEKSSMITGSALPVDGGYCNC